MDISYFTDVVVQAFLSLPIFPGVLRSEFAGIQEGQINSAITEKNACPDLIGYSAAFFSPHP